MLANQWRGSIREEREKVEKELGMKLCLAMLDTLEGITEMIKLWKL